MIRFLLNQELISLTACDPNMTVLNFLRQTKRLTGTKEGCASGDCGACSVTLVELRDEQLHYSTINSCLTLMTALDGKQLITVEHLRQPDQLHPVQQAMVDTHGSQCGFCTPGIVMSLFTHRKSTTEYNRTDVVNALAGNLCRCTGYQPILNAAQQLYTSDFTDHFDRETRATMDALKAIRERANNEALHSTHGTSEERRSFTPRSLDELDQLLQQFPDSKLMAGGTDLSLAITQMQHRFSTLIHLNQVPELNQVGTSENGFNIGAACPISQCEALLANDYADLGHLFERFASLQIRNQASIGGNIANASPIGDTPPALLATGASLLLRRDGAYRELPLDQFFLDYKKTALQPREYIVSIIIPRKRPETHYKIYKVSKRLDDDISAVCAAIKISLDEYSNVSEIHIAFGGMAAIPKRATYTEQVLLQARWSKDSIEKAVEALRLDFSPLSDLRASAEYRMLVAANLLRKCWLETSQPTTITRVSDDV